MNKRIYKKMISVLMVCSIFVVSCGNNDNKQKKETSNDNYTETVEEKEFIKLQVSSRGMASSGEQQGWYAELLKERLNINLNYEVILPDNNIENYSDSDIIIFNDQQEYEKAIKEGLLLEWSDELLNQYGNDILDNMNSDIKINREISEDNKLYGIGAREMGTNDTTPFAFTWDVRWDLYQKISKPEVNDLQDYKSMFEDIKDLDEKDEKGENLYAVAFSNDERISSEGINDIELMVQGYYGYDKLGMGFYDIDNGEFYGMLYDEEDSSYIGMLRYINELNREGLFDPKSREYSYDDFLDKINKGGIYFYICHSSGADEYNTEEHINENKMFRPLVPKEAKVVNSLESMDNTNYYREFYAIGKNSKNPERALEYINYLSTSQGMLETQYGPEGVAWKYDEQGNTELLVDINYMSETEMPEPYSGLMRDGTTQLFVLPWAYTATNGDNSDVDTYMCDSWISSYEEPVCDADSDWRESTGCVTPDQYLRTQNYIKSYAGYLGHFEIEDAKESSEWQTVSDIINEKSWDAIYAENDEQFNQIIEEMKAEAIDAGYEKCIEICEDIATERYEFESKLIEYKTAE